MVLFPLLCWDGNLSYQLETGLSPWGTLDIVSLAAGGHLPKKVGLVPASLKDQPQRSRSHQLQDCFRVNHFPPRRSRQLPELEVLRVF